MGAGGSGALTAAPISSVVFGWQHWIGNETFMTFPPVRRLRPICLTIRDNTLRHTFMSSADRHATPPDSLAIGERQPKTIARTSASSRPSFPESFGFFAPPIVRLYRPFPTLPSQLRCDFFSLSFALSWLSSYSSSLGNSPKADITSSSEHPSTWSVRRRGSNSPELMRGSVCTLSPATIASVCRYTRLRSMLW